MAELMTLEEVASYLRVTEKTIYRLVNEGGMPAIKVGHLWRFKKSAVDEWLDHKSVKNKTRILVIDDDETICSLFKETLEEAGHRVTTTSESTKGLELVKEGNYDLVFLDLKMPVMDGVELFRQIKVAKPELPVTIITGYPESDLMMAALTHGPFGVMNKPFIGSDILKAVNNYVRFGMPTR